MDYLIKRSLEQFFSTANILLKNTITAAYSFGSAVYDDFHIGYSDLDFFIIVEKEINKDDFVRFSTWRRELRSSNNPYLSVLEGEIISKKAIKKDIESNVIYWGTSTDRLNSSYGLSGFSLRNLIDKGILIYGSDIRNDFPYPSDDEMLTQVDMLIRSIKKYAQTTTEDIHSIDWFFLISQSLYWLNTLSTTGKTDAAQWVLENCETSWSAELEKALTLRENPALAESAENKLWLTNLGDKIQTACADLVKARDKWGSCIANKTVHCAL